MARTLPMRGKALQTAAIDTAHLHGWRVAHFHSVTTHKGYTITPVGADGKGWPDLFLVRNDARAIEVKGDGDSLKPEQEEWLGALERAGVPTMILTPKLYRDGTLDEFLR